MKQHSKANLNRRSFLRAALLTSAAPLIVPGSVLGLNGAVAPSNRFVWGTIGIGNRARATLPTFLSFKEIQMVAMSDCRADRLQGAKEIVDTRYGNQDCMAYPDFRDLLARRDIDAVMIATGNRWHAVASIYAARAGKDIYCEKPVCLAIEEGRSLVETCRRHGVIYQAGTQRRSTGSYRFAMELARSGKLGRVHTVEMQVWTGRGVPHQAPTSVPTGVNYDMWLGQVQWRPFVPNRFNGWMNFLDTADGYITDMGCHYTDLMQWTLNRDHTGPIEFEGKAEWPDPVKFMNDTPINCAVRCKYADGVQGLMYQRGEFKDRYIKYIGDEGWVQVDDQTDIVTAEPKSLLKLRSATSKGWDDVSGHIQDLLHGMRTRQQTICNPLVAHRAQAICLSMTISMRVGRRITWDPVKERFNDEDANRLLRREARAPWRV